MRENHKEGCRCGRCKAVRGETFGNNNPCFRGGITLKKHYYCKICNSEIAMISALYRRGLCRKCCFTKETKNKMSLAKLGTTSWNKGLKNVQKPYWLGKSNREVISKHHIDGNKKNNAKSNFLKIKQGEHRSLHWNGYKYLAKVNLIKDYIRDFCLKYQIIDAQINDGKVIHHLDCNRENNNSSNLMYLKDKKIHNKLHQEAYLYLVGKNRVNDYIRWFFLMKKENNHNLKVKEELNNRNSLKTKEIQR